MTPNSNPKTNRRSTLATKLVLLGALLCAPFWHNVQAKKSANAYVQTEVGDSLFSIARVVNPGGGITNEQVMASLLRHNRHAFKNQNLFLMFPGARLKIPSVESFKAEQKSTAQRFYQRQLLAAQKNQIPPRLYALESERKKATVQVISKTRATKKDKQQPTITQPVVKQKKADKTSEPKNIGAATSNQENEIPFPTEPSTNLDSPDITSVDPVATEITDEQETQAETAKGFDVSTPIIVLLCIAIFSSLLAYFFSKNSKKVASQSQYIDEQEDINADIYSSMQPEEEPEPEPASIIAQQPVTSPPHTFWQAEAVDTTEPIVKQEPSIIKTEPQKDMTTADAIVPTSPQRNHNKNTHTVALDAKQALAQIETIVRKVKQKKTEESQPLASDQLDLSNSGLRKHVGQACEEMGIERVILPPLVKNTSSEEDTKEQKKTDTVKKEKA